MAISKVEFWFYLVILLVELLSGTVCVVAGASVAEYDLSTAISGSIAGMMVLVSAVVLTKMMALKGGERELNNRW